MRYPPVESSREDLAQRAAPSCPPDTGLFGTRHRLDEQMSSMRSALADDKIAVPSTSPTNEVNSGLAATPFAKVVRL